MNFVDEQLERRISYHLDGELDADQQVDLYRRLLREPDARRMLDDYQQADAEAGEALRAFLSAPRPVQVDPPRVKRPPRRRMLPWGQILATAACVALAVGVGTLVRIAWPVLSGDARGNDGAVARLSDGEDATPDVSDRQVAGATDATGEHPQGTDPAATGPEETSGFDSVDQVDQPAWWRQQPAPVEDGRLVDRTMAAPLIAGPREAQRVTDRSVVGFYDPGKQAVYLIEVDRQRTVIESAGSEL